MMKNLNDIESELLEDEALRCQVEKALSGRKKLPVDTIIREQSEKWKGAWAGESGRKMETV